MKIIKSKTVKSGTCTLVLPAELNVFNVAQLKNEILEALNTKNLKKLSLNIEGVKEMDSACFQLLIKLKKECDSRGVALELKGSNRAVFDTITIYNMNDFFGLAA